MKTLEYYFKQKPTGLTEIGEPLVEPIEKKEENLFLEPDYHVLKILKLISSKLSHLPLEEICVTLKPKFHKHNSTFMHNKIKKFIMNYIKDHSYFKPLMIMIPEFNKSGILHYHGIIYFDNASDYWTADMKRRLNNKFGICCGKKVYNIDNYITYITKDIHNQKFTIRPFYYLADNFRIILKGDEVIGKEKKEKEESECIYET